MRNKFSTLSDEELLQTVAFSNGLTPLEDELASRLEDALDEIESLNEVISDMEPWEDE